MSLMVELTVTMKMFSIAKNPVGVVQRDYSIHYMTHFIQT